MRERWASLSHSPLPGSESLEACPSSVQPPPPPQTPLKRCSQHRRKGSPERAGRLDLGGMTGAGSFLPGPGRGSETGPVHLVPARSWARRGRVPAEPAAAGRGRLGHALFIAEQPARRLPSFSRAGCGLRGGAGARSLHNIVAAPRVMAPGRRGCAALAAGGGRQRERGWEGSGVGGDAGSRGSKGTQARRGWCTEGYSL